MPPGIPDFFTRARSMRPGECQLTARARSELAPIAMVHLSTDGGADWEPAELDPEPDDEAMWHRWSAKWRAEPGVHELCCRATDTAGNTQPLQPTWNLGGYANNAIQRVPVWIAA